MFRFVFGRHLFRNSSRIPAILSFRGSPKSIQVGTGILFVRVTWLPPTSFPYLYTVHSYHYRWNRGVNNTLKRQSLDQDTDDYFSKHCGFFVHERQLKPLYERRNSVLQLFILSFWWLGFILFLMCHLFDCDLSLKKPSVPWFIVQGIHKRMVRFQKLTRNLFLTLHGHNVHRQQRQLSNFLMRYQQFASLAYCGAAGPVSKMASQQEKDFCVLRFEVSRSVITVHETYAAL